VSHKRKRGGGRRRSARGDDAPTRSCVACRRAADKADLLRFVRAPDGSVVHDVSGDLPGRGAWTCADRGCIAKAVERGGFRRAFEEAILADASGLAEEVSSVLTQQCLQDLGLGRRFGDAVCGRTEALEAIKRGEDVVLFIAEDLSERSRAEVEKQQGAAPMALLPAKELVGRALGRRATGVVAVRRGRVADRLLAAANRRAALRAVS
jgi:predicted RNA-binding protein YlxR (DUF448 family)